MRFVKAAVVAASVALVPGAVAAQTSTPSTSTQSGTQQPPVADRHQARGQRLARQHPAKLGADPRRLAGGDRDDRARRYLSSRRSST